MHVEALKMILFKMRRKIELSVGYLYFCPFLSNVSVFVNAYNWYFIYNINISKEFKTIRRWFKTNIIAMMKTTSIGLLRKYVPGTLQTIQKLMQAFAM